MRRAAKTVAAAPAAPSLSCVRASAEGALLMVSVVPNAKRTEVVGLHDGALRVRLAAPPVDGKANDTLTAWLAAQLDLPRRDVALLRGASSRQKQLTVSAPALEVLRWVQAQLDLLLSD
jgi:uncharacterized protein